MPIAVVNAWRCRSCTLACAGPLNISAAIQQYATTASSRKTKPHQREGNVSLERSIKDRIWDRRKGFSRLSLLDGASKVKHAPTHTGRNGGPRPQSRAWKRMERLRESHEAVVSSIMKHLDTMRAQVIDPDFMLSTGLLKANAKSTFEDFASKLMSPLDQSKHGKPSRTFLSLRRAYEQTGHAGLESQLRFMLQGYNANIKFDNSEMLNHARLADFRYPFEWYPAARQLHRQIHIHVGPTNSGKTYHALKRLEQASTGVYAGPLRLLAHEVYSRLKSIGKPCNLITGDERILSDSEGDTLDSCTVEMVPMGRSLEVAVIDEIQMIGHEERGWAWTSAFLGLQAKEVHLCGEERALPLVRELTAATGDTLHIHRYERLTPLKTMTSSLDGDLKRLRKGDCIVLFSRRGIHAMKKEIEKETGKKVAVVYGSLPPEVRAQQARLFNEADNGYDILVASDAIGMGLNLSIKRIIFESTAKLQDGQWKTLSPADIKQIAGRAGRYRVAPNGPVSTPDIGVPNEALSGMTSSSSETSHLATEESKDENVSQESNSTLGLVTTLHAVDLKVVQRAMVNEAAPITSAGILPPDDVIVRFASYFPPSTPFSYVLLRLHEISRMQSRFRLCQVRDSVAVADILQSHKGLSISDRLVFCAAPVSLRDVGLEEVLKAFASCVEKQSEADLLDFPMLKLELLDYDGPPNSDYLYYLEVLHKSVVLYSWLSYRFSGIFVSQAMAFHLKKLIEDKIDHALTSIAYNKHASKEASKSRKMIILEQFREEMDAVQDVGDVPEGGPHRDHPQNPFNDQVMLGLGGDLHTAKLQRNDNNI